MRGGGSDSRPSGASPAAARRALVLLHGMPAGILDELVVPGVARSPGAATAKTYRFQYLPEWVAGRHRPVSASLPVRLEPYESDHLFPYFVGLLAEGDLRRLQARLARVDEHDEFALLLATAGEDAAGAVTIQGVEGEVR